MAAAPFAWRPAIAEGNGLFATERTIGAVERLATPKQIQQMHGHWGWLTGNGHFTAINNRTGFAATSTIMLLVPFFIGGGRHISVDYWLRRRLC